MMDPAVIGISAALTSAAAWAAGAILFKKLGEILSPVAMTLAKGVVSLIFLSVAMFLIGIQPVDRNSLMLLLLSGVLGIAFADTFFFKALQDIGPHALVVLMMFGQVLTAVFAVLFLGERPSVYVWAGIALVVVGVAIVVTAKLTGERKASGRRGVFFGLLSILCMSVSIIIAKKGLDTVPTIQATFIRMFAGTVGIFIFGAATKSVGRWVAPFRNPKLLWFFVFSVCVVTFGGFWMSLVAIKYVDVSIASTLNSTEPLFVLPLAAIFLKEKITLRALLGTLVTLAGIVLLIAG